jgi:short-subunit dehydrogenase
MQFDSMRILLTGASGGIGQQLTQQLLSKGASVLAQGRNIKKLNALKNEAGEHHCELVTGDLADARDREAIVAAAQTFGVNVLINNAGISEFAEFDHSKIENLITTNITGTLLLTQMMLPLLKAKPRALIVNVGSTFGAIGFPGYVAYSATKHAIRGFSEALHRELSDTNIDVLYVSPRATATDMNSDTVNSVNRLLKVTTDQPETVAQKILSSMDQKLARQQLGWPEKLQVKLNAIFPGLVDGAIGKHLPIIRTYFS